MSKKKNKKSNDVISTKAKIKKWLFQKDWKTYVGWGIAIIGLLITVAFQPNNTVVTQENLTNSNPIINTGNDNVINNFNNYYTNSTINNYNSPQSYSNFVQNKTNHLANNTFDTSAKTELIIKATNAARNQNHDLALHYFMEIDKNFPADETIKNAIGVTYSLLYDESKAISYYDEAIQINPNFLAAYKNKIWAVMIENGVEATFEPINKMLLLDEIDQPFLEKLSDLLIFLKYDKMAILILEKILEHDNDNAIALQNKGIAQLRLGSLENARDTFLKKLSLNENDIDTLFSLSIINAKLNNTAAAIYYVDEILEREPDNEHAKLLKKDIEQSKELTISFSFPH